MSAARQSVALLGATGSIGTQTLDVLRRETDRFDLVAIAGGGHLSELAAIAQEFHVRRVGIADEFDRVHSVHRALEVGALNRILPPANLRPYLINAVENGIAREKESHLGQPQSEKSAKLPNTMHAALSTLVS